MWKVEEKPGWLLCLLMRWHIESGIPSSLEEAAYIDGANYITRYLKIIMPICKPVLATCVIFAGVGQWNSFMDTILYCPSTSLQTLQSLLYQYMNQSEALARVMNSGGASVSVNVKTLVSSTTVRYTVTTIVVMPILMLYPMGQKYFVKGIMMGAVKG